MFKSVTGNANTVKSYPKTYQKVTQKLTRKLLKNLPESYPKTYHFLNKTGQFFAVFYVLNKRDKVLKSFFQIKSCKTLVKEKEEELKHFYTLSRHFFKKLFLSFYGIIWFP